MIHTIGRLIVGTLLCVAVMVATVALVHGRPGGAPDHLPSGAPQVAPSPLAIATSPIELPAWPRAS